VAKSFEGGRDWQRGSKKAICSHKTHFGYLTCFSVTLELTQSNKKRAPSQQKCDEKSRRGAGLEFSHPAISMAAVGRTTEFPHPQQLPPLGARRTPRPAARLPMPPIGTIRAVSAPAQRNMARLSAHFWPFVRNSSIPREEDMSRHEFCSPRRMKGTAGAIATVRQIFWRHERGL